MNLFPTLDDMPENLSGKIVLMRVDFNLPMRDGFVSDKTRIRAALPSIQFLQKRGAKIGLLSHFGKPKGQAVEELSLRHVISAVQDILDCEVKFASDAIGAETAKQLSGLAAAEVLLLENTRFHPGEENGDPEFAEVLAKPADFYVNDAFSAAHRAHASTSVIAQFLPSFAGRSLEKELSNLQTYLETPAGPLMAVVGGAKISTKITLLESLLEKTDILVIGGAMANSFLLAKGLDIGKSLAQPEKINLAKRIMEKAAEKNCELILPSDVVVATEFAAHATSRVRPIDAIRSDEMVLDAGPDTVDQIAAAMERSRTLVWNGPLGAFEVPPFHTSTVEAAQFAGKCARAGKLIGVAGGGDTVAALNMAQIAEDFTYISTGGGAFLEWLEGRVLPGVAALASQTTEN